MQRMAFLPSATVAQTALRQSSDLWFKSQIILWKLDCHHAACFNVNVQQKAAANMLINAEGAMPIERKRSEACAITCLPRINSRIKPYTRSEDDDIADLHHMRYSHYFSFFRSRKFAHVRCHLYLSLLNIALNPPKGNDESPSSTPTTMAYQPRSVRMTATSR